MAYVLDPAASVTHEVRCVAIDRVDEAIDILANLGAEDDIEHDVHEVRKRCKEARALARLVRSSLGDEFGVFNGLVRDAADELASIRDAHAILATFDNLRMSGSNAAEDELDGVRAAQAAAADEATHGVHGLDPRIGRARDLLGRSRDSIDRWDVPDEFDILRQGVEQTYERGLRSLQRARHKPTDDRMHEWRKSVKTLWYQLRLLERAAPSVLEAMIERLDGLAEALGDDHDLAVLVGRLTRHPRRFGDKRQVKRAIRLARAQQDDLRRRAFRLGATVYAETPASFAARIEAYWTCTIELGPELVTAGIAELARDERREATPPDAAGSMSVLERERKFLVAHTPELPDGGTVLRQGYLAIDKTVSVRVRDAANEGCTLTIKAGRGAVRTELEWPISDEQFAAAWEHTRGRRIHKTRYRLPLASHVVELDVFHDDLDGLMFAEVEFESDHALETFEPPPWFGSEVTDDVAYTNASLAMNGLAAGRPDLADTPPVREPSSRASQ